MVRQARHLLSRRNPVRSQLYSYRYAFFYLYLFFSSFVIPSSPLLTTRKIYLFYPHVGYFDLPDEVYKFVNNTGSFVVDITGNYSALVSLRTNGVRR